MQAAAARARGVRTLGSRMLYPGKSGISFAKVILPTRCVSGRFATESVAAPRVAHHRRPLLPGGENGRDEPQRDYETTRNLQRATR